MAAVTVATVFGVERDVKTHVEDPAGQ